MNMLGVQSALGPLNMPGGQNTLGQINMQGGQNALGPMNLPGGPNSQGVTNMIGDQHQQGTDFNPSGALLPNPTSISNPNKMHQQMLYQEFAQKTNNNNNNVNQIIYLIHYDRDLYLLSICI